MHILNIIQCTNLGGMEHSNLLLLIGLKALGHSIQLISLNPLGKLAPLLHEAGIPAIGLDYQGRFGWRSLLAMRRTFRRYANGADAILMTGHNVTASIALINLPVKRKILALHFHHFEPDMRSWHWPIVYKVADWVFDHLTFVSEFIRQEALTIRADLASKSSVLPNPFRLPSAPSLIERDAAKQNLNITKGTSVVGNAGWLIARKRFDVFLRVAALVSAQHSNVAFLVAGDGPERDSLVTLAAQLNIADKVRFMGWQADLNAFYKALDVMLFNTDFDALGRTPVEAAAFGVPVVASVRNCGLREVFPSESEAFVLEEHDIERLTAAVLELLMNPAKREESGRKLRERVGEYGRIDRHAAAMERLLTG